MGRADAPMVEVFYRYGPSADGQGGPMLSRGLMQAADGLDMSRFRRDFEYDWTSRYKPLPGAIVDCPAESAG
jgi:hypothetical protein